MYGKVLGTTNVATGIALLPSISNRVLFVLAAALLLSGAVVFVLSMVMARKSNQTTQPK